MHIFSHKTVQLFVRSLRGYIKSFFIRKKVDSHIVLRHNVPRPIVPLRYSYNKDK